MSQWSESKKPTMDDLSSLVDGELDASEVSEACGRWRDDPETRVRWHAYHLIGDVLRCEDLASSGARDAAFLTSLRERLAEEPVVLAPSQATVANVAVQRRRRSWGAPMAAAAGFVAVAGVLVVTQMAGGGLSTPYVQPEATLANVPARAPVMVVADGAASVPAGDLLPTVLNGQLIRDVRLDEYLAAHKKFGGSSVPGGPSGFLRNAAVDGVAR